MIPNYMDIVKTLLEKYSRQNYSIIEIREALNLEKNRILGGDRNTYLKKDGKHLAVSPGYGRWPDESRELAPLEWTLYLAVDTISKKISANTLYYEDGWKIDDEASNG